MTGQHEAKESGVIPIESGNRESFLEGPLLVVAIAVVCCFALVEATAVAIKALPADAIKQVDLTAWVQAIGSILAILATAAGVWWSHELERRRTAESEERHRAKSFIAARAFLPSTLSELADYCRLSAAFLNERWKSHERTGPLLISVPDLPPSYREVFSECIRHSELEVERHLSKILVCLQVHDARLRSLRGTPSDDYALIAYLHCLGELHALITWTFEFSRGEADFRRARLQWDEFHTAYRLLGLRVERFVISDDLSLEIFTRRAIERKSVGFSRNQVSVP